ncbi:MAG: ABC transporter ATP-binding protein [Coriobacteriaceae bacterium]|nr:ABC transporter ATP-binding protein [Coriobacteriaceae bacterium]
MRLEVKDLDCGWKAGEPIQRFVNFTLESGEICCMLGPNGCGKTTLLKTVMGLIPRMRGSVLFDDRDVQRYSPKERSSVMAYVSQDHEPPFAYRVRDVVMLGRAAKVGYGQPSVRDWQVVESALDDMGVRHLRNEAYTNISGGELQLVMIARALTQEPQMLVLDEPTASLDYGNAMRVVRKVRELADRGYGILMTTHSPDQAFMLDSNVLLLQRDRPMQFGSATEIINDTNMLDAYGIDVETKEFLTRKGDVVRMCAPVF